MDKFEILVEELCPVGDAAHNFIREYEENDEGEPEEGPSGAVLGADWVSDVSG